MTRYDAESWGMMWHKGWWLRPPLPAKYAALDLGLDKAGGCWQGSYVNEPTDAKIAADLRVKIARAEADLARYNTTLRVLEGEPVISPASPASPASPLSPVQAKSTEREPDASKTLLSKEIQAVCRDTLGGVTARNVYEVLENDGHKTSFKYVSSYLGRAARRGMTGIVVLVPGGGSDPTLYGWDSSAPKNLSAVNGQKGGGGDVTSSHAPRTSE